MATLATNVSFQCLGLDGKPLAGGKVYTYEAGTTTPKSTYTTHEGDVPNTNPVILDQNGKAKIFLGDGAYRIRIEDKDGALVDDINQISRYVTQSDFAEFQQTVETGINELEQVKDQIDTYVDSSINDQKGYAGGIVPLDENLKIDPIYIPELIESGVVPSATTSEKGVAKTAETEVVQAGTNDTDFITPKKLLDFIKTNVIKSDFVDVKANRAIGVTYTNPSTSQYLNVRINATVPNGGSVSAYMSDKLVMSSIISGGASWGEYIFLLVPPLATYRLAGAASIQYWGEA